jgi:hypothetical protein
MKGGKKMKRLIFGLVAIIAMLSTLSVYAQELSEGTVGGFAGGYIAFEPGETGTNSGLSRQNGQVISDGSKTGWWYGGCIVTLFSEVTADNCSGKGSVQIGSQPPQTNGWKPAGITSSISIARSLISTNYSYWDLQ